MDDVSRKPAPVVISIPPIHQQDVAESASAAQKIKARIKARFAITATRIAAWKKWFSEDPVKAVVGYIVQIPESLFMNLPAKVFWWISDYGTSTKRIIGVFFALNGIFTLIYSFIHLLPVTDLQEYTTWPLWLPMSFAQTILIPFSITEIELKSIRLCMTGLVVTHVVLGYVILAALVTRFAVMFQDQGP